MFRSLCRNTCICAEKALYPGVFFRPLAECRGTMRPGPAKQKPLMEKMISAREGRGLPLSGSLSLLHKEPFLPLRPF